MLYQIGGSEDETSATGRNNVVIMVIMRVARVVSALGVTSAAECLSASCLEFECGVLDAESMKIAIAVLKRPHTDNVTKIAVTRLAKSATNDRVNVM